MATITVELGQLPEGWDIPALQAAWDSVWYRRGNDDLLHSGEREPRTIYVSLDDELRYRQLLADTYGIPSAGPPWDGFARFYGVRLLVVAHWPIGTLGFLCEHFSFPWSLPESE